MSNAAPPAPQQSVTVATQPPSHAIDAGAVGGWATIVVAIAAAVAILYRFLTRELKRDISDVQKEHGQTRHDLKNVSQKVEGLHALRTQDVERIVRLEGAMASMKEGQTRIETALGEMKHESAAGRAEIVESLRELRDSRIKSP